MQPMPKMQIRSDRYSQYKKDNPWSDNCVPVDLYGKQVFTTGKDNLEKAGEDIKEFYDLTGDAGLKGE